MADKVLVATCSLAGCFGCHMSLLDLDERLLDLLTLVDFDRSPINDRKEISSSVDIGLIEGGLCNAENVHVLRQFRASCRVLVAVGECAATGGVPAMRNHYALRDCLQEAYVRGIGVAGAEIPSDAELPLLLDKVVPLHHVVKVDYTLPGCPPSADVFWHFLTELLAGREPTLSGPLIRYD